MKKNLLFLILLLFNLNLLATHKIEDALIVNGDTLFLSNSPLEDNDKLRFKLIDKVQKTYKDYSCSTGCHRGYVAEWVMIDSVLYLSKVKHYPSGRLLNHFIEQMLKRKFKNGLLKAEWVNGDLSCGKNEVGILGFDPIYKNQYKMNFVNGLMETCVETIYSPPKDKETYIFLDIEEDVK